MLKLSYSDTSRLVCNCVEHNVIYSITKLDVLGTWPLSVILHEKVIGLEANRACHKRSKYYSWLWYQRCTIVALLQLWHDTWTYLKRWFADQYASQRWEPLRWGCTTLKKPRKWEISDQQGTDRLGSWSSWDIMTYTGWERKFSSSFMVERMLWCAGSNRSKST